MITAIAIVLATLLGVAISYALSRYQASTAVYVPDSEVLADFAKRRAAAVQNAKADNEKQLSKKEIIDSLRDLAS